MEVLGRHNGPHGHPAEVATGVGVLHTGDSPNQPDRIHFGFLIALPGVRAWARVECLVKDFI